MDGLCAVFDCGGGDGGGGVAELRLGNWRHAHQHRARIQQRRHHPQSWENSPLAGLTGIEGVGGDTPTEQRIFTPQEITFLEEYAQERDGNLSLYSLLAGIQVTAVDEVTAGRPQFVSVFLIDATNFPPRARCLRSSRKAYRSVRC
ncbi:MAG UNVERIFIED_CONTAM: hypothetical protein LVT10_19000 [Anaerolineae bacterium]